MNRTIIYSLEQIRSFDYLWSIKDALFGLGGLAGMLVGTTNTVVYGLAATQTTVASLVLNIAQGWIYQQAVADATQYGALPADSTVISQVGYLASSTLTITVPTMTSGQSAWCLIEAKFTQADVIRTNDPNNGVLPYVNTANPSQPFQGPGNNNQQQDTERLATITITPKYGTAATTGSNVPPTLDAGYVPLYLIDLAFGQSQITNAEILVAGPAAYSGYTQAPFFPGLTGTVSANANGSHHAGINGQANKILFTSGAEIQGVAPFANVPCSNSSPSAIGGIITNGPDLPVVYLLNANPNGTVAGNVIDMGFQVSDGQLWVCTTSGNSSSAVWTASGGGSLSGTINSGTVNHLGYYAGSTTIASAPYGTIINGQVTLGSSGSAAGSVVLSGSTSGTVTVGVPAAAGSTTFTLPATNGTAHSFLKTDGSGNTAWSQYATEQTGQLTLGIAGTEPGSIVLNGATSGACTLGVGATAGSVTFTFPTTTGSNQTLMTTNGSGQAAWTSNVTAQNGSVTLGAGGFVGGSVVLAGSTSGSVTMSVPAVAGSSNFTMPAANSNSIQPLSSGSAGQFVQYIDSSGVQHLASPAGGGTVNSGTANQVAYYAGTGTAISGDASLTISTGTLAIGQSGSVAGSIQLFGGTSGSVTMSVPSVAGSTTFSMPNVNSNSVQPLSSATTNNFVQYIDSNGVQHLGSPSGSGTVNSGTTGQIAYYASSGTAVSGDASVTISSGQLTLGQSGSVAGSIVLEGATSGSCTLSVPAVAGSTTFQLPSSNGSSGQILSTNGSGVLSWSNTTPRYTSPAQTMANDGSYTFTHGLGVTPFRMWMVFVCTTNNAGYTVGQSVVLYPVVEGVNQGFSAQSSSTQFTINNGNDPPNFIPPGGGTGFPITYSDWSVYCYAEP